MYADPPYDATRSYEAAYKVIDRILGEATRPTSPFTAQTGARMIDALLERARHIPVVVLSFGNETVSLQELEQKMVQHGRRARAIEIPYARLAALSKSEKPSRDRELLVLGWDAESPLLRRIFGPGVVERHLVMPQEVNPDVFGPEAPAPHALAPDGREESHPPAAQNLASEGRRAVPELQSGVDHPDTILGKTAIGRDLEGVVLSLEQHGSTFPRNGQEVKNERQSRGFLGIR